MDDKTLIIDRSDFVDERADVEVTFPAHITHNLLQNAHNTECHNCWGCSCHSPDILIQPCNHSVEMEQHHPEIVRTIEQQAARYGAQVHMLQCAGLEEDGSRIRKAWDAFRYQIQGTYLLKVARTAYYESYNPIH